MTPINYQFYVIIVGCGRVGLEVATRLSTIGFNVTVVEKNPERFEMLPDDYGGFVVVGDATEREVMERAKANRADLLIVTTEDDATNYFVAMLGAKIFGIPNILALVNVRENVQLFEKSGIRVISPINLAIEHFERSILEGVEQTVGETR